MSYQNRRKAEIALYKMIGAYQCRAGTAYQNGNGLWEIYVVEHSGKPTYWQVACSIIALNQADRQLAMNALKLTSNNEFKFMVRSIICQKGKVASLKGSRNSRYYRNLGEAT